MGIDGHEWGTGDREVVITSCVEGRGIREAELQCTGLGGAAEGIGSLV